MTRYFRTRAAQDIAIAKLLEYIGTSKVIFPQNLLEDLEFSDHEIMASILLGFVEIAWIDGKGGVYLRVSDKGRDWIVVNQWKLTSPSPAPSVIHRAL